MQRLFEYLRKLTDGERTDEADLHLGMSLAFVAGAANAGGFLAVKKYTSHMTGIVSAMAGDLAQWDIDLALVGLGAVLSFLMGAAFSTILINWGRRKTAQSVYALPLLLEAFLMLCFGLLGYLGGQKWLLIVPVTIMLLCFIMGLQNAIITKISKARIRTTHVTGIVTDIGIEFGKMLYWNSNHAPGQPMVKADRPKLLLLISLLSMFFLGGVAGALGFKYMGFISALPLALLLLLLALVPVIDDLVKPHSLDL